MTSTAQPRKGGSTSNYKSARFLNLYRKWYKINTKQNVKELRTCIAIPRGTTKIEIRSQKVIKTIFKR